MKKERVIFILIILIILVGAVLLGGRENTYDKSKEKKQQTEQTVSRSEKNSRLCKNTTRARAVLDQVRP